MKSIKVKELIERLKRVNPEADFQVIALNYPQEFSLTHGGGDGCTEANCDDFGPYISMLHRGDGSYIRGRSDEVEQPKTHYTYDEFVDKIAATLEEVAKQPPTEETF
jgi:hypothetical protein